MEKLSKTSDQRVAYEVTRKSEVGVKTRAGEMRVIKKMKLIQKEKEQTVFVCFFLKEIDGFRNYVFRVTSQCKA